MPYLLKLRTLLLSDRLYIYLAITITIVAYFITTIPVKSKFVGDETTVVGIIDKIKYGNEITTLEIKSKEKLIAIYDKKTNYNLGDKVILYGKLEVPKDMTVFNLFDYKKYLYNNKIFHIFKIDKITKIENNKNIFYTLKQLPPTNSRTRELCAIPSVGSGRK